MKRKKTPKKTKQQIRDIDDRYSRLLHSIYHYLDVDASSGMLIKIAAMIKKDARFFKEGDADKIDADAVEHDAKFLLKGLARLKTPWAVEVLKNW